jgi:membrane protein YqaA with SNARE-associated domain
MMTSNDPLHAVIHAGIGAVAGAAAGVGMNIKQHRALQKKQFNKGK